MTLPAASFKNKTILAWSKTGHKCTAMAGHPQHCAETKHKMSREKGFHHYMVPVCLEEVSSGT
jgi:hypothetical protein